MKDSKDHKAAAEPPLDCRVGRINTGAGCAWQEDEDGVWDTACGGRFVVSEGTPHENDMAFCPYCGKSLEQHRYAVHNAELRGAAEYLDCEWTPDTPDACPFCAGTLCNKCGAGGCGFTGHCEHDSLERHEIVAPNLNSPTDIVG